MAAVKPLSEEERTGFINVKKDLIEIEV